MPYWIYMKVNYFRLDQNVQNIYRTEGDSLSLYSFFSARLVGARFLYQSQNGFELNWRSHSLSHALCIYLTLSSSRVSQSETSNSVACSTAERPTKKKQPMYLQICIEKIRNNQKCARIYNQSEIKQTIWKCINKVCWAEGASSLTIRLYTRKVTLINWMLDATNTKCMIVLSVWEHV